jgi:hypothetical protein
MIAEFGKRIAPLQVADPIQHEVDAGRRIGLEGIPEHFAHFAESRHVLTQAQDEEDAEEGLCPAEEVWQEAFLPRHGGKRDWPLEAGLALLLERASKMETVAIRTIARPYLETILHALHIRRRYLVREVQCLVDKGSVYDILGIVEPGP